MKRGKTQEEIAKRFKELEPVELEPGTEYLLDLFDVLNDTREYGMGGPLAVSYQELKAYCELMDETVSPWEVETLRAMDRAYLDASYELSSKGK